MVEQTKNRPNSSAIDRLSQELSTAYSQVYDENIAIKHNYQSPTYVHGKALDNRAAHAHYVLSFQKRLKKATTTSPNTITALASSGLNFINALESQLKSVSDQTLESSEFEKGLKLTKIPEVLECHYKNGN